jgi:methylated-DNA-[protein]-cysteine S-methyltransferase
VDKFRVIETPTGPFAVIRFEHGGLASRWLDDGATVGDAVEVADLEPSLFVRLGRYFAGEAVDFGGVPTPAGPAFFRRCWEAARRIPPGTTRTYGELALRAGGTPAAARAAGQSMRRNPLPVIVPCHRVVAGTGLGGYAGSVDPAGRDLRRKAALLRLEGARDETLFDAHESTQPGRPSAR